jgi:hypothetical protein
VNHHACAGCRRAKSWAAADAIRDQLAGLGVSIDDKKRTWEAGLCPAVAPERPGGARASPPAGGEVGGVPCALCGKLFGSRNLVIIHEGGAVILAQPDLHAMMSLNGTKEVRRMTARPHRRSSSTSATARVAAAAAWPIRAGSALRPARSAARSL